MFVVAELKRRNVVRVAVLYGLAAWLILQVVDVLVPALGLPDWVMRFVALLLMLGFPLVLIFSWVYELTPEGPFATRRDYSSMCGRYVTPDEAAMERTYNLTARQWESWMDRAYWPSDNVAPSRLRTG